MVGAGVIVVATLIVDVSHVCDLKVSCDVLFFLCALLLTDFAHIKIKAER